MNFMKKLINLFLFCLFFIQISPSMAFEAKNIELELNQTCLVLFDDKVESYDLSNQKTLKVELLNNLFNNKTQVLLTALSKDSTFLTIKTVNDTYRIDISILEKKENIVNLKNIKKDEKLKQIIGDIEIDLPPVAYGDNSFSLNLDMPPEVR